MELLSNARELRKHSTDAERKLWQRIRNRQLSGYKFKRQVPVEDYIVDIVCPHLRLIVEIDGGQHQEQQEYDSRRTKYLETLGYVVIRYWNNEVLLNIDGVLTALTLALYQRERELMIRDN